MEKKLSVNNLVVSFRTPGGKVQAVRNISFDLNEGETLAIVGESGSGKSVTSKAILGILAGNSIIEGGSIIYDGMDLLKITEEDFYHIRGDRIAMIFQDPLSSLNPIMRVGRQLTEAMLLKSKAARKSSRKAYKKTFATLEETMKLAGVTNAELLCSRYRDAQMNAVKAERKYEIAHENAVEALDDLKDMIFRMEKDVEKEYRADLKEIRNRAGGSKHNNVVTDEEAPRLENALEAAAEALKGKKRDNASALKELKKAEEILEAALQYKKPDFMRIYSDEEFSKEFEEACEKALIYSAGQADEMKKIALEVIANEKAAFAEPELDKSRCRRAMEQMVKIVEKSIDPMEVHKDGLAYTFAGSLEGNLNAWFKGIGREVVHTTINDTIRRLEDHYAQTIENAGKRDYHTKTLELLQYLKENALGIVSKVTKTMARYKALKLMEEVGINDARRRFHQYPFEFSGGMRQRIVIAIALAADPDILICDEPTTALDVTIQAQILELINRIKEQRHLSIIFITHDLGVVANMADRIAVMYAGKIVETGTSEDVFYSPAHPYTWALLSAMPDTETNERLEAIPGTPPNMICPPPGDAFAERNKYALKVDFKRQPPMFKISETHYAATWLLHPDAPKVEVPKTITDRIERMRRKQL